MKKILSALVLLIVFSLAAFAGEKYVNSKLGFSFTPMPEWTKEVKEKGETVQIDMYSEDTNYFITLSVEEMGSEETFADVVHAVKNREGYTLIREDASQKGIYNAELGFTFDGVDFIMFTSARLKADNKLKISAWAPTAVRDKTKAYFKQALDGLKFVKEYLVDSFLGEDKDKDKGGEGWGNETQGWFVDGGAYTTGTKEKFAFSLRGDPAWKDYTLKAKFKNGKDGGLLVRAKDKDNAILFLIKSEAKKVIFKLRKDGEWRETLAEADLSLDKAQILDVQIEIEGNKYTASINGEEILSVTNDTFSQGRIGLYLYAPIKGQYWDDVVVVGEEK